MINITNEIKIEVDDRGYTIVRKGAKFTKKGLPVVDVIGYYTSITNALKACAEYLNRQELAQGDYSLKEAVEIIQRNNATIEELMKGILNDKN